MSKTATYSFKFNQARLKKLRRDVMARLIEMGNEIANKAKEKAPYDSGDLANSIRSTEPQDGVVWVIAGGVFNGVNVPYAKRREYENNKNPHTKYYMRNAFQEVTANYWDYFKGITK